MSMIEASLVKNWILILGCLCDLNMPYTNWKLLENWILNNWQAELCLSEIQIGSILISFLNQLMQNYSGEEELCCVYVPTNHLYIGDIFLVNTKDVIRPNLSVREGIGEDSFLRCYFMLLLAWYLLLGFIVTRPYLELSPNGLMVLESSCCSLQREQKRIWNSMYFC